MKIIYLRTYILLTLLSGESVFTQTITSANQGFSMKVQLDNKGNFGKYAYPDNPLPETRLGVEYPVGQRIEHLFGAGIWVGGKLDTAQVGTSSPLRLVSVAYEGWAGPYNEFFPATTPADTIWKVYGQGVPRPSSWEAYWGNSIPRSSISDNDFYMAYNDYTRRVTGHVPLNLKVIQSSFVWNDSTAEAIQIVEYKIMNNGLKTIDSAYVGIFSEGDIGFATQASYWMYNNSGYFPSSYTGYTNNPVSLGTTPFGVSVISTPRPLDSLRLSFRWFPGSQTPPTDAARYTMLSSGVIQPDEYPALSDSRFFLSFGPFTINPIIHSSPDTLVVAFAFVAGQTLSQLNTRALHAKQIYVSTLQSASSNRSSPYRELILPATSLRR